MSSDVEKKRSFCRIFKGHEEQDDGSYMPWAMGDLRKVR
jgi:hypothetical protein